MLIEFTVGNFLSFKEIKTFSAVAASIKEHADDNLINTDKNLKLLKSAVIYGANASGKSNLIKAMGFMKALIYNSAKDMQTLATLSVERFALSSDYDDKPAHFEIIFIHDTVRYRYGFEMTDEKIIKEWLFFVPNKMETELFTRSGQEFHIGNQFRKEAKGLIERTRENALFLSVTAIWNGETANKIMKWFNSFNIISGINDDMYQAFTLTLLEKDSGMKSSMLDFLKSADLGIDDLEIEEQEISYDTLPKNLSDKLKKLVLSNENSGKSTMLNLATIHKKYGSDNKWVSNVKFDINKHESEGTKKAFSLSGPLLDTLMNGKTLVIDELDSKLHPLITQAIIKMFNSQITNNKNAQLIFATHDTSLLDRKFFRRDQIWFTEKDPFGATDLYSLVDYKEKVRNDASYGKEYMLGKYGAIPFLGDFYSLLRK